MSAALAAALAAVAASAAVVLAAAAARLLRRRRCDARAKVSFLPRCSAFVWLARTNVLLSCRLNGVRSQLVFLMAGK